MKLFISCDTPEIRQVFTTAMHTFTERTTDLIMLVLSDEQKARGRVESRSRNAAKRWTEELAAPYSSWVTGYLKPWHEKFFLPECQLLVIDTDKLQDDKTMAEVFSAMFSPAVEASHQRYELLLKEERNNQKLIYRDVLGNDEDTERFLQLLSDFEDEVFEVIKLEILKSLSTAARFLKK